MTQEGKKLLLKDICERLPYGVNFKYGDYDGCDYELKVISPVSINDSFPLEDCKPYLRPMSSMTEGELRDFAKIKFKDDTVWEIVEFPKKKWFKEFINVKCKNKNNGDTWIFQVNTRTPLETYYGIDWLNKNHFDYRGLIEKGLALKAPEDMYKEN